MNIEFKFLQKAIEDRNYINFTYEKKKLYKIKPLKLIPKDNKYYLHTQNKIFEFDFLKKIQISKEKF